jgi:hypothetical protein
VQESVQLNGAFSWSKWPGLDGIVGSLQETIALGVAFRVADAPCRGMTARPMAQALQNALGM